MCIDAPYTTLKMLICVFTFMVLILDGNSETGAYVRSNLCYLSCLSHLIRSRAIENDFFPSKTYFLQACAKCSELPSNISAKSAKSAKTTKSVKSTKSTKSIVLKTKADHGRPKHSDNRGATSISDAFIGVKSHLTKDQRGIPVKLVMHQI